MERTNNEEKLPSSPPPPPPPLNTNIIHIPFVAPTSNEDVDIENEIANYQSDSVSSLGSSTASTTIHNPQLVKSNLTTTSKTTTQQEQPNEMNFNAESSPGREESNFSPLSKLQFDRSPSPSCLSSSGTETTTTNDYKQLNYKSSTSSSNSSSNNAK